MNGYPMSMPMPNQKVNSVNSTERYTCTFSRQQLDALKRLAHKKSKEQGKQVSVADLVRSAIHRTYGGYYLDYN